MKPLLLLTSVLCLNSYAFGQLPVNLKDIYPPRSLPFESVYVPFYAAHNKVIFEGFNPNVGYGLWAFNGRQVALIEQNYSSISRFAASSDGFYFLSPYDVNLFTLYKHGGTPGVSIPIDEIKSNNSNNVPSIAVLHDRVFYQNWEQATGYELWCATDSFGSGKLVLDGYPGAGGVFPRELIASDSLIYYRGGGSNGPQLWRSDGTAAGTFKLIQFDPAIQNIQNTSIKTLGNKAYFLVRKYVGDTELWVSDGTVSGTKKWIDVPPCFWVLDRFEAFFLNGKYCYLAEDQQNESQEWVATDGTAQGTEILLDLPLNSDYSYSWNSGSVAKSILNGVFFFYYLNKSSSEYELWKSDGTAAGTKMVQSFNDLQFPQSLASTHFSYFFLLENEISYEIELWLSDGTTNGTKLVKSLGQSYYYYYTSTGAATDSVVIFKSPFNGPDILSYPIRSDGTEAGTYALEGIQAAHLAGSNPGGFVAGPNQSVFFRAIDTFWVNGIWQSNTHAPYNTSLIDTTYLYTYDQTSPILALLDQILWFPTATELRVMNASGTVTTIPLPVTFAKTWTIGPKGAAYFLADNGKSIWRTDGTVVGTYEMLKAPPNSNFYSLIAIENKLFFVQNIQLANQAQQVWSSDGTLNGSASIYPIDDGSTIFLRNVEGRLTFSYSNYSLGNQALVVQGYPLLNFFGYYDGDFKGLTIADEKLFMLSALSSDSANGAHYAFWVEENGYPVCLQKFKNITGTNTYSPWVQDKLHPIQNKAIFGAGLRTDDVELWVSDGTVLGTHEVRAINPSGSSNPDNFIRYNEQLWLFTANDGQEVAWWATDGTGNGTFKVAPLATVKDYFVPLIQNAYRVGKQLYFSMNDGIIGQEPWIMVLEDSLVVSTLSPLNAAHELKLWPNPSDGTFQLSLENPGEKPILIEISNATGLVIYQEQQVFPESGSVSIRLPQQTAGVYFLRVVTGEGTTRIKQFLITP